MRKKINFVVFAPSPEHARKNVTEWFALKKNLSIDSVTPYQQGSYQVWLSYDEESTK